MKRRNRCGVFGVAVCLFVGCSPVGLVEEEQVGADATEGSPDDAALELDADEVAASADTDDAESISASALSAKPCEADGRFLRMFRAYKASTGDRRMVDEGFNTPGYTSDRSYKKEIAMGIREGPSCRFNLLYECVRKTSRGDEYFSSFRFDCEGRGEYSGTKYHLHSGGKVSPGRPRPRPVWRCLVPSTSERFNAYDPKCLGVAWREMLLGYAYPK